MSDRSKAGPGEVRTWTKPQDLALAEYWLTTYGVCARAVEVQEKPTEEQLRGHPPTHAAVVSPLRYYRMDPL